MAKAKWKTARSPVKIQHFGYVSNDQKEMFIKMQRYLDINLKQMEEYPKDPRSYFNLAMHMLEDDLVDDAVRLLLDGKEHPTKKYLVQVTNALQTMKPIHLIAARGHVVDYFSKNSKRRDWLNVQMEKREDDRPEK